MQLKIYWENLAEREKTIIIAGSILFSVIIIIVFFIQPFFSSVNNLADQAQSKREIISWLQPAAEKIQEYAHNGYPDPQLLSGSLIDKINASLRAHQLNNFVTQTTALNDQQVEILFKQVPFDAAMDWLTAFWLASDAQVKQATITPLKTTGLVSMQLVLQD